MKLQFQNKMLLNGALILLVPSMGLTFGTISYAQPSLEEIVVTAQRRTENLQDVAIAVSAFQGDELTHAGVDTQRSLSMMTPNVAVNSNVNFISPYIRGIGTQYANPGLEPSVGTYFNDLYLSRPSGGFMQFHDIERVEVLKGPQGTLYGRNTTGGAIRVITKNPTDYFEAGVGVTLGNYQKKGTDFYVSGPLGENVRARLAGQLEKHDGWVENIVGGDDMNERNSRFLHGKLHWDIAERLSLKLDADWTQKQDTEGAAFEPIFRGGLPEQVGAAFGGVVADKERTYSGSNDNDNSFRGGGGQIRLDYEFDSFTASSITGYRLQYFRGFADLDTSSVSLLDAITPDEKTHSYSQEFQFVSSGDSRLNWTAGIFYYREKGRSEFALGGQFVESDLGIPNGIIGGDGDIEVESIAPYGQISYEMTEEWEILFGLRYTDETKKVLHNDFYISTMNHNGLPVKPAMATIPVPSDKLSFDELSPKIQLTWRPTGSIMLYATYQEGFKSGGFNMPSPSPNPVTKVGSETVKSTELGWKMEFDRLRFNGAIFHYKIEDLQVQVTDLAGSGAVNTVRNAGDAKVDGIEFDLTYAATENLELGAGAGWQDARFGSVPNGQYFVSCADAPKYLEKGFIQATASCAATGGLGLEEFVGELKGNELPHSPEVTGYLRATYNQPLDDAGNMAFSILVSYSDKFSYTSDNLYNEPSKTLVNANVTWHSLDERYVVSLFGTNLTDEKHSSHMAPDTASGGWRVSGPPRMYGMRFAVNF